MLKELIIDNLALLKHIHVSFKHGMTCFTGETGAGKSILLDAIELTLGGKCPPGFINAKNEPLETTAIFTIEKNSHAYHWLLNNNFLNLEHNSSDITGLIEIVLHRSISKKNNSIKSKASINKINSNIQQLKELGQYLIYIHGQHEHLQLIKEQNQLKILDGFGRLTKTSSEVHAIYKQWSELTKQLQHNLKSQSEYQAKKQLLEFKIAELENSDIKPNEWQDINKQHQWLANQQLYVEKLNQVHFVLEDGDDQQQSVNQLLHQITNILNEINSDNTKLLTISDFINQAIIQIDEANTELRNFLANLDTDPESLNKLDQRISQLYELARKHKIKPELLPELLQEYYAEIAELNSLDDNIQQLTANITKLEQEYTHLAQTLSKQRHLAAKNLSSELTLLLKKLRMPEAELSIVLLPFNNNEPKAHGLENCSFLIKTNAGQNLQPLATGISGGELSRVALATQVATAQVEGTPSLIFDEVDVGIGGGTAEIVGKLLYKMGKSTQVMCITHLAQVAAQADNHIKVSKTTVNNETITSIDLLNQTERINELARMIGGLTITTQTVAHAEELLKQANVEV
jgi:DNA repair protein RecN (Recombination protein N)